jgi:hypothetical protein
LAQPEGTTNTDIYENPAAHRETHQIHTSEIRAFLACRRRWNWAYRDGYVPESQPKPLEFGIAFHKAMEAVYDPDLWSITTPEEKLSLAITVFATICEQQRERYLATTNQSTLLEADGDDYAERVDLGIGMLTYYCLEVHPKYDKWFRPVMVEVPFQVPLVNPKTGIPLICRAGNGECGQFHVSPSVVTFDGRIDAIIEDLAEGGYFVLDHKSAKTIRRDDRILQLDTQVGGYSWAAKNKLNLNVRGFLYIEYRKDYPRAPDMLKRSYRGRAFSTNKDQATNYDHFSETVYKHDRAAYEQGLYDEYLRLLNSSDAPQFHKRFPIIKNRKQLANMGNVIYEIAYDMVTPGVSTYPTVGNFSCQGCAYYTPCHAMFMGEDYTHSLSTSFKKVK